MSTKTTFKRVALVAVASLGLGVLTSVSAFAADEVINTTLSVSDTGDGTATATAVGIVGGQITFTFGEAKATTDYTITTDGKSSIKSTSADGDVAPTSIGTNFSGGISWEQPAAGDTVTVKVSASAAATSVITVSKIGANSATVKLATLTITWGATPVATSATAKLADGKTCTAGTASSVTTAKTAGITLNGAGTGASLCLTVLDQAGNAINGVGLDVTISGPGLVSIVNTGTVADTGTTRTASLSAATQAATNIAAVGISADGTSGVGTVTVSAGTTVLATATVNFYDAIASISAVQVLKVGDSAGGTLGNGSAAPTGADVANTPAVILTIKDKNGISIPGLTNAEIKADSSNLLAFSTTITAAKNTAAIAGNATAGTYNVQVNSVAGKSGDTSELTFKALGADGETYVKSAPVKFALGGSVATVALSLDKASYSIGSAAKAIITAKDSSGNAAKDGDHANMLSTANGLVSSYSVNKDLFKATTVQTVGGVGSVDFNAPVITGSWSISGTTGTGPSTDKLKALTATATVTGGNDAAIASLISKINALSKLIAKIQKKLGIK